MTEITIETREDWNNGEFEKASADLVNADGDRKNAVGIGYVDGDFNTDKTSQPIDDLLFYYRFDEQVSSDGGTVNDFSGNSEDAETVGGVNTSATGVLASNCFEYDGNEGVVNNDNVSSILDQLESGDNELTLSWWTKGNFSDLEDRTFTMYWGDGSSSSDTSNIDIAIYPRVDSSIVGDSITVDLQWSDGDVEGAFEDRGPEVWNGEWRHVVITIDIDADEIILYLDGEHIETNTGAGLEGPMDFEVTDQISIGGPLKQDRRVFDGKIDEIMVFDRVLSESEVELLYFNGHQNDNFEGEYTSETFEPENGQAVEVTELEITADIDTDASAEVVVEALDESSDVIDSDTISVNDGTDTYSVDLDEAPKFRIISEHEVSL